ncbi:hypothetical protein [Dysgonomonas massiliensis]|uniref:hypothetical protein n=1 Tax=Dysgonomonas massiliensis TaxID=2040292 RepID=UPI000C771D33|nr:hypothetical protein [Dysgonomonas massiliensis]
MKITKLLTVGIMSALMLTSCLGDSDSKISGEAFAFKGIWGEDLRSSLRLGNAYGLYGGYKILDESNKVLDGDFAEISYTLTNPSNGINEADNLTIKKKYLEDEQNRVNILAEGETLDEGEIYLSNVAIGAFARDQFLGDRWLFAFSPVESKEASDAYIYFYYDKNRQVVGSTEQDEYGRPLEDVPVEKNQVVIDIRVYKTNRTGSSAFLAKSATTNRFVANLQNFRYFIEGSNIIDVEKAKEQNYLDQYDQNQVAILFRYIQEKDNKDKNGKIYVERYLGTTNIMNSATSSVFYSMSFSSLN